MYKRMGVKKLGKTRSHRDALIKNQLRTLFSTGLLKTTTPKAKVMKAKAQALISKMNKGDVSLVARRDLQVVLGNTILVKKALEYSKKEVTGVRIVKTGYRAGDNAEMSRLELIGYKVKKSAKKVEKEETGVKETPTKIVNKGIEKKSLDKKVDKKVGTVTKERARTRSGL